MGQPDIGREQELPQCLESPTYYVARLGSLRLDQDHSRLWVRSLSDTFRA